MKSSGISRRNFLAGAGAAAGLAGAGILTDRGFGAQDDGKSPPMPRGNGNKVALVCDPADTVATAAAPQWALGQLHDLLTARGVTVHRCNRLNEAAANEPCIVAAGAKSPWLRSILERDKISLPDAPETLALASAGVDDRSTLFAVATDPRGLVYALLEIADRITHTDPPLAVIESQKPMVERPANSIRSVARLFASDVEDKPWFNDKAFWPPYLTMLATERFNRFNLTLGLGYDFARQLRDAYFYFAYPFLLAVPGYNVRAVGLPDAERDNNLAMLRFISEQTVARGLDFQLGLWTHIYRWTDSPQANYTIDGLNSENHGAYCRDALAALLKACPAISGVTIRTHGESGVAEGNYDFWKTVFDGVVQCGRKVEIDLHAKGINQRMIDTALATGMPINVSPKFWAEHQGLPYHQASIRALEMPPPAERAPRAGSLMALSDGERRFMRYSYGDLFREDRKHGIIHRVWPGTQRVLVWGDPEMASAISRASSFCGSQGAEWFEPLSFKGRKGSGLPLGRTAYQDAALRPPADWEKYRYTYRLWGRMLYNPDCSNDVWRRLLRKQWGNAAPDAEKSLAIASGILPLITSAHLPSAANNNYWPEMYTNMSITDATVPNPYGDSPNPRRFGTVSPLDPTMFCTIDEYADEIVSGKFSGKCSPAIVAAWLAMSTQLGSERLQDTKNNSIVDRNADLNRLIADVEIQFGLGSFFSFKMMAALLFALHKRTGHQEALKRAVKCYEEARDAWQKLARRAETPYGRDVTFGPERFQRGHWSDRLAAIEQDVQRLAKLLEPMDAAAKFPEHPADVMRRIDQFVASPKPPQGPGVPVEHKPPSSFRPGQTQTLAVSIDPQDAARLETIRVRYRHVNQAEDYQVGDMRRDGNRWTGAIPAAYTQSPFPLQYFFELRNAEGQCELFPGLKSLWDQPYFVVRQA